MRHEKSPLDNNLVNDATRRFSRRVDNYAKYRPGYPPTLVDFLKDECQLTPACIVADIGSGTGLLTGLFLDNGNLVYGVEPNLEMRQAAERILKGYSRFRSLEASAESTTLESGSIDFVTVGRALHWFDFEKALSEFSRILKPQGWVVIVWLKRKTSSPLLAGYDKLLLTYAKDHKEKKQRQRVMEGLLTAAAFKKRTLEGKWTLDFENLKGQTLSFSVSPEMGDPNYGPMLDGLDALFQRYQENGKVTVNYETVIYYRQTRI
jgi:ubiquinone/menaquinone biosynthesis C-methylase UbiE